MALAPRFLSEGEHSAASWLERDSLSSDVIPAQYRRDKDGLTLLTAGKIIDPLQGCACSISDVAQEFLGKLTLDEREIVLVDVEAGVESFGRGLERNVDTVIVVVEPARESLEIAERVGSMAAGIGIRRVWAILNKVPSDRVEQGMRRRLEAANVRAIGAVRSDPEVAEASYEGQPLRESRAREEVRAIARGIA